MKAAAATVQRLAARQQRQQRHSLLLLRRCNSRWTGGIGSDGGSDSIPPTAAMIGSFSPSRSIPSWSPIVIASATSSSSSRSPPPPLVALASRSFAAASGGGNGGDDDDKEGRTPDPPVKDGIKDVEEDGDDKKDDESNLAASFLLGEEDDDERREPPPPVVDLDTHSNADTDDYDPFAITESFGDTSYYYYPPDDEQNNPGVLKNRYEGMTNEELLDGSTIPGETDPVTGVTHTWDSLIHSPPIHDRNKDLPRGTLVGTVVSTKMQKTINVAVDRFRIHLKYRKRIRYTRKFMAHDEGESASDGDLVMIVPSQRISKKKHFVLREILRAKGQL